MVCPDDLEDTHFDMYFVFLYVFIISPSSHLHLTHNSYTTQFLTHYYGFGFTYIYMDRSYGAVLLLISIKEESMIRIKGHRAGQKNEYLVLYMCVSIYVYDCISVFIIYISYTYISFCILVCIHLVCIFVFISSPSSHIHLTHNSYTTQFLTHYFGFGFTYIHTYIHT